MRAKIHEPLLSVVRQAAWELAASLVEQSDFTGEEMIHARFKLADLSILRQEYGHELMRLMVAGLHSCGIDEKIPNQGRMWAPFFLEVAYEVPLDTIKVVFNFSKHPELQALKEHITLLRHQNKLTPSVLKETMRKINPRVRYGMVLKKLPEVHELPAA